MLKLKLKYITFSIQHGSQEPLIITSDYAFTEEVDSSHESSSLKEGDGAIYVLERFNHAKY
ncbi:hypothetical protein QJS04_geneDACA006870 [Acorus gramineus]|uniref:Uncharacterized protein n=1 Tax=Acorus gramineus TaxID=55184 RepID=A0AAV9AWY4_ACOGR|nr:hypothetical protein QJS04_geneDACA006870 [Acorus gramineus]